MARRRLELVPPASDSPTPHPRSGHRVVVTDGNLYALGGYNPDVVDSDVEDVEELTRRIFIQMWKFNFGTRQWKELKMVGQVPLCLASHTVSLHGKTLFTFGGSGIPFGVVSTGKVLWCSLDPASDSVHWHQVTVSGDLPEKKYGHSQLLEWPYMYIVGGTTGYIYNMDVHRLDLNSGLWECLWDSQFDEEKQRKSPVGRYRHEMVVHDSKLLLFGGGQSRAAFPLDKIAYFDLRIEEWKEIQTTPDVAATVTRPLPTQRDQQQHSITGIPPPRRCHSCVKYNNGVYIFGGRSEEQLGDLWRLCLNTMQWCCLLPHSASSLHCFFHSAAVTSSGCMYIFGGVTKQSTAAEIRNNDVYRVWLDVPSLQELCWSVFSGRIHTTHTSSLLPTLLEAGVPQTFVQRLAS